MNTQTNPSQKSSAHPLMLAAAVAVLLACGVGVAAMMGWLPSSAGHNADPALNGNVQTSSASSAPARVLPNSEPVHHHTAPSHHTASSDTVVAAASPASCANCGVIDAVNEIDTRGQGSGVGVAGGAVVGGLLGNQVGNGRGRELATLAGAIGGAVAGNQIEGNMKKTRSFDISVRLNDGSVRTFHQAEQPAWRAGDHVRIVDGAIRANG
jgi:outer membrane lipoprotein SlyB